ncbi:MAG: hypothetical protein IJ973_06855, partial [Christensenellaceae bacterium]|nr:hypothetical protein [Christensenellaceae bacterium]
MKRETAPEQGAVFFSVSSWSFSFARIQACEIFLRKNHGKTSRGSSVGRELIGFRFFPEISLFRADKRAFPTEKLG